MELSSDQRRQLLDLARQAIRASLSGGPATISPSNDLPAASGCFVSLHDCHTHALRGCVGQMEARGPLERVVQQTAVHTLGDPRFCGSRAVTLAELPNLEIEISLLTPLVAATGPLDFEPLVDGIHLSIQGRTGVFLPQVARDTGWTREQLLNRLCTEKMGLPLRAWQSPGAVLRKFQTIIVGPEPFVVEEIGEQPHA